MTIAAVLAFVVVALIWWRIWTDEPLVEKCERLRAERNGWRAVANNLAAILELNGMQGIQTLAHHKRVHGIREEA